MPTHLILGGARSGKSRHAEQSRRRQRAGRACDRHRRSARRRMRARITRHQADRPAGWTVPSPRGLAATLAAVAAPERCVIVDCLTLWLANLLDGAETLPPAPTPGTAGLRPQDRPPCSR